jgi:class 3 adenylate cyclase
MARRFPAIPAWRFTLISMLAEVGNLEEARSGFERLAANGFVDVPRDLQWVPTMIRLADTAHWLGDAERAAVLREHLAPFSGLAVIVGRAASCQGPVDTYLGRLSMTTGDYGQAVTDFEAAIELASRMDDRPFLLQSRYGLARALSARGAAGDRDRAVEELTVCLDGAEALGMRRLVESALAARLEVQGIADIDVLTSIEAVVEAVGSERPDLSILATGDGAVTILFSDIENSTLINERLGDQRWLDVLREHNSIFRRRLAEHRGYEVKSQGDGFMLAFGDPASALDFALTVQGDLVNSEVAGAERISVRMGIHSGEAIAEDGDLFGRSVVLAARIAAQAVGGEILVSEALAESCGEGDGRFEFTAGRELELKGLAGTHRVYRAEPAQAAAAA